MIKKYTLQSNQQKLYFFICLILLSTNIQAQDSLTKKVKFTASAKFWTQWNYERSSKVYMPAYIKDLRKRTSSLPTNFETITDNPLIHGASYFAVKTTTTLKEKVKLNIDLYGEQRGASYGLFYKKNLVLFPVINIEAKDSLKVLKKDFIAYVKAGMFLDEKMDEGLTIFNIDAQGFKINFERKKWAFTYTIYGDFYNGIGLNIDDIYAYKLKRKLGKKDNALMGFSINHNKKIFESARNNVVFNFFGHKNFTKTNMYFQVGYRPVTNFYNFVRSSNSTIRKLGILVGLENQFGTKKFTIKNTLEARYYGAIFNENNYDFGLRFREPARNEFELYANTVGKFLYPLRKFNTPFSQWAVYNEYIGNNVFAINLRGNIKQDLSKKLSANINYDINYIQAKNNLKFPPFQQAGISQFIYPFFTTAISYKILDEVEASWILTNQSMNLDLPYPTHYLLSRPRLGVRLVADFLIFSLTTLNRQKTKFLTLILYN